MGDIKDSKQELRDFIDSLRSYLGMRPLYFDELRRPPFSVSQRWIAGMLQSGNRQVRARPMGGIGRQG